MFSHRGSIFEGEIPGNEVEISFPENKSKVFFKRMIGRHKAPGDNTVRNECPPRAVGRKA